MPPKSCFWSMARPVFACGVVRGRRSFRATEDDEALFDGDFGEGGDGIHSEVIERVSSAREHQLVKPPARVVEGVVGDGVALDQSLLGEHFVLEVWNVADLPKPVRVQMRT